MTTPALFLDRDGVIYLYHVDADARSGEASHIIKSSRGLL